jgi:hypothetical protein
LQSSHLRLKSERTTQQPKAADNPIISAIHLLRKLQQQPPKLHKEQVQKLFQLHLNFVQFRYLQQIRVFQNKKINKKIK